VFQQDIQLSLNAQPITVFTSGHVIGHVTLSSQIKSAKERIGLRLRFATHQGQKSLGATYGRHLAVDGVTFDGIQHFSTVQLAYLLTEDN